MSSSCHEIESRSCESYFDSSKATITTSLYLTLKFEILFLLRLEMLDVEWEHFSVFLASSSCHLSQKVERCD